MDNNIHGAIKQRLSEASHILIASHVRPDGDAIGAVIGFGLSLQQAGKRVQMVLADGVPSAFRHLEGAELVKTKFETGFDTFITVDCADYKRVGKIFQSIEQPDINIDHHVTNENFGKLNFIEPHEPATSAILTNCLPKWGLEITKPVAAALLSGIITDTLGFRTSSTTPETLQQAAKLMSLGVDMPELYMRGLVRRSYEASRYWGCGLSKLERKNGVVWGTLTLEDRKQTGYSGNDDADLINAISAVDGFKVGMIFVEQHGNKVKISWRALEKGVDVSPIAKHFGGGGHAAAAGADIPGALNEVQPMVLKTTFEMLNLSA